MGFVFRAEDEGLMRPVALKVMRPEVAAQPTARERFLREGRAAAAVKSDHVITIYQVGETNGVPYLAMEYLDGLTLDDWLKVWQKRRQQPVPAKVIVRVAKDILKGLVAAHEKGLIHRDIKPANLWIEADTSRVKLLDFGLTRVGGSDKGLTHTGQILGTPAYMAPEQARGLRVDARADLFSVGVVLHRIIAGKNPFQRDNLYATIAALAVDDPPPAASFGVVAHDMAELIDRLLSKSPDGRPATAKAALAVVMEVERQMRAGDRASPTTTPPVPPIPPRPVLIESGGEEGEIVKGEVDRALDAPLVRALEDVKPEMVERKAVIPHAGKKGDPIKDGLASTKREQPHPASPDLPGPTDAFAFSPISATAAENLDDDKATPLVRRSRTRARTSGGGSGKRLLLAGLLIVAVIAATGIGGVVVFLRLKKDNEVAKDDKKADAAVSPEHGGGTNKGEEAAHSGKDSAKGTAKRSPREPGPKGKDLTSISPAIALGAGKTIKFDPPSAAPQPVQKPTLVIVTDDIRLPTVRGVFPPQRKEVDPAVLWQARAGFQGQGEKLNLDLYSPQSLKRVGRVEVDGDGAANPICDLAKSADLYAHAANGKITVYNTREKATLLAGFDPYADKPDHKKAGLAAIYLTEPPDKLITVSTAGAVHVWAIAEKKMVGEYTPAKGAPGKVAAGKAVAADPGRTSIVVAVGGAIYRVTAEGKADGAVVTDLGGNVGQSLGLASGGGQLLYVFETEGEAKKEKEKAVMLIKNDGKTEFYRWPDKVGEPVSIGWAGDQLAVVGTGLGSAVWFESSEGEFKPIALVKTPPADRVRHATSDDYWVLLPDKGNPNRSILAQYTMPPQGLYDLSTSTKRPTLTLSLDEKALAK